ncbi:MAG: alkaline phosphatase D family protein, partial [Myxococcales bacterium]|nr:alkaline phosphatase D family protein [Myxococcales bacterium]
TDAGVDAGWDAGPPPGQIVTSCDEVVVEGAAAGGLPEITGWPILWVEARGDDAVFRAPAVARSTFLFVGDDIVRVDPREPSGFDVPGLAADCGPFAHGVASGDPRPDGVTLWTRWSPPAGSVDPAAIEWVVATDRALVDEVGRGTVDATEASDWTVHVELTGLAPATTYWYRFSDPSGEVSVLGRTRTAPTGSVEHLRFALMSCSSLFSGWFNAYRRLAERDALDLIIHVGDYIYDFVDEDERVRVPPSGEVEDLVDLASHRRRHALYLSDPDLRAARQAHPWFLLWDNHDLERDAPEHGGGAQAFREWNPIPLPTAEAPADQLYRVLRYGDLADVMMVDMYLFQRRDTLPGSDAPGVLSEAQYAWLTGELSASTATWRLIGMQKVFADFDAFSGWTDFPEARSRLIGYFASEGIGDNVFLTGDSHFTIFQDVVDDPATYDPSTGVGAVGAEFLATSISRGNFDEQIGMGMDRIIEGIRAGFLRNHPHQVDLELTSHGYGILDVTRERVVAETWYSEILRPESRERFGLAYAVPRGANRYDRTRLDTPTP